LGLLVAFADCTLRESHGKNGSRDLDQAPSTGDLSSVYLHLT